MSLANYRSQNQPTDSAEEAKSIVDGRLIGREDDPHHPSTCLRDSLPATHPAVSLNLLEIGISDRADDPLALNYTPVGTQPHMPEIRCRRILQHDRGYSFPRNKVYVRTL